MHPQRMCTYTCKEDIHNLPQIDCRSRSIASYHWDQESKICTGKWASACKHARLSRRIDQRIARGTDFQPVPKPVQELAQRLHSSSFLGLLYRIRNMNP